MLMNNLDPDVAERPDDLVVYGGTGRAARSWEAFDAIVAALRVLASDETLVVQSGKPVAVLRTHAAAPRVVIANSNLVPRFATWDEFRRLEQLGLTMYGQMTAGSWIYIGSQGIVQGTYETFAAVADRHFGGSLAGRLVLTAGLGGMGGAQPLAATMHGAVLLGVEVDEARIDKRHRDALRRPEDPRPRRGARAGAGRRRRPVGRSPWGWSATRPTCCRSWRGGASCRTSSPTRRARTTCCTATCPPACRWPTRRGCASTSQRSTSAARRRARSHTSRAMRAMQQAGAVAFDYGNNIRTVALDAALTDAFEIPGFVPEYIRPLFCEGKGPFRWVALSGDPADIHRTDELVLELFPHDAALRRWITLARERIAFQGLPARICWLGQGDRATLGVALNDLVARGEVSAPIVIGRDHLDTGSVASPFRETEGMRDGSDAIADWAILNALSTSPAGPRGCRSITAAASASATRCTPARSPWRTDRR